MRSSDDHIDGQRLAALGDEQPTADERGHLEHCADCAREVEAHRALLAIAGAERGTMELPLTRWESLSERLRSEGLIAAGTPHGRSGSRFPMPGSRTMLQIAAALLLVATGAVMGRVSAGASFIPGGIEGERQADVARLNPFSENRIPVTFATVEEAQRWKDLYAGGYQNAVSYLAQHDSTTPSAETPAVMRARLSALDQVSRTMRQALNDAPYDPVINDFYINSFGQREATLRQLNAVLPQGVRMNGF